MQTYETLFITVPDLTEEDEKSTVEVLSKIVTDGDGTFHANERLGRKRLGYPIRKFEEGVYTRFLYDSEKEIPQELERRIKLSDKVLRSLTVRLDVEWADHAKKQAVIDAERRVEAAERAAAEAVERAAAEKAAALAAAAGGDPAPAAPPAPTDDVPAPAAPADVAAAATAAVADTADAAPVADTADAVDTPDADASTASDDPAKEGGS